MSKSRVPTWVSLVLLGVGLLAVGIPGLFVYMRVTATKVHRDSQKIPSVMESPPLAKWAGAAEQARQIVRASMSENNLAGLSVAVGIDGEIVWAEGFGFADIQSSLPVTPHHRFRTGTASIVFTSAAIGLLLDQGRLKLDDEIQRYVPEFPAKQWPVTVRQAMGDVAGLKGEDPDDGVLTSSHCERPADAVALFAKEPLLFQPGTEYRDSTFGWVLLSAVVEAASNTPFAAFLNERILRPLGMLDTFKESVTTAPPDAATSYNPRFAANPVYGIKPLPKFDYSCHAGSNGFLSTPSDLVRFGMAINRGKLLRPQTVQTLQTPQRLTSGKSSGQQTSYGLGWDLKTVTLAGQQVQAAGHNGHFWVEEVSSLLTFPERGLAVAVMSNVSFAGTPSVAERVAQTFLKMDTSPASR
ncbi:MAG TPA: serine hydrolase domain-containing protein [Bryobacteraceae bacterium]|nr:serine hydrolase domain-containing protein [Bryobacteraceae bacterium]